MDEPPSSPPTDLSSPESALAYYKSQYEQLEHELADFQASSQELEAELERDVEAAEKRERALQERAEFLGFEVDEWKVCRVWMPAGQSADFYRLNTSNPRLRQALHKPPCKRRLRHFGMRIEHCSSSFAISKSRMMILRGKHGIHRRHWRTWNQNTTLQSSEMS